MPIQQHAVTGSLKNQRTIFSIAPRKQSLPSLWVGKVSRQRRMRGQSVRIHFVTCTSFDTPHATRAQLRTAFPFPRGKVAPSAPDEGAFSKNLALNRLQYRRTMFAQLTVAFPSFEGEKAVSS